jgi:hypothetical protein
LQGHALADQLRDVGPSADELFEIGPITGRHARLLIAEILLANKARNGR